MYIICCKDIGRKKHFTWIRQTPTSLLYLSWMLCCVFQVIEIEHGTAPVGAR